MSARLLVALASASFALASVAACGDLKSGGGDPGAPVDGSSGDDAGEGSDGDAGGVDSSGDAGGRGPGPHGSLPTGYCCSSDAECRFRHCATVGSQKMCIEECDNPSFCTRPDLSFTCDPSDAGGMRCAPPAGFVCLDPQTYVRGTLPVGACCNGGFEGTNDGTAGSMCEGNDCTSTGNGPLVCTIVCRFQSDCPGGFVCNPSGNLELCVRPDENYTCQ